MLGGFGAFLTALKISLLHPGTLPRPSEAHVAPLLGWKSNCYRKDMFGTNSAQLALRTIVHLL